jgi:hypothetical protein
LLLLLSSRNTLSDKSMHADVLGLLASRAGGCTNMFASPS